MLFESSSWFYENSKWQGLTIRTWFSFCILVETPDKTYIMLKELIDLVRQRADEPVINNPAVPNEYNNAVVAEASNTVASGLRNVVAGGGLQSLLALFSGGGRDRKSLLSNPIVSMMMGHFAGKLINKYNLGSNQANNLSGTLIPDIIGTLINKTNDSSDSQFSLEKLLASITGGKSNEVTSQLPAGQGGLQDLLRDFSGGGQNSTGGLIEIVKSLASGAQQQQQRNGDGGLMDMINGYLQQR
jgi:hypothetical protein